MSTPQKYAIVAVVAFMVFLLFGTRAMAHDSEYLEKWRDDWAAQFLITGMTEDLAADYVDMATRHPWFFHPESHEDASDSRVRASAPTSEARAGSVYRGMGNGGSDVERWRGLVAGYWPADQVELALCVMRYESGGNPDALNQKGSSARGLFQVLASLWAPHYGVTYDQLYDPTTNVPIAYDIWTNYGWGAWSAYKRGRC